jgi:hypothetical protein
MGKSKMVFVFEKGFGTDCQFFFSINPKQKVPGFVCIGYPNTSKNQVKIMMNEYGASEIENPVRGYGRI